MQSNYINVPQHQEHQSILQANKDSNIIKSSEISTNSFLAGYPNIIKVDSQIPANNYEGSNYTEFKSYQHNNNNHLQNSLITTASDDNKKNATIYMYSREYMTTNPKMQADYKSLNPKNESEQHATAYTSFDSNRYAQLGAKLAEPKEAEQAEKLKKEVANVNQIDMKVDLKYNEIKLSDLSERIEACLKNSKYTLNNTMKLFSQRNENTQNANGGSTHHETSEFTASNDNISTTLAQNSAYNQNQKTTIALNQNYKSLEMNQGKLNYLQQPLSSMESQDMNFYKFSGRESFGEAGKSTNPLNAQPAFLNQHEEIRASNSENPIVLKKDTNATDANNHQSNNLETEKSNDSKGGIKFSKEGTMTSTNGQQSGGENNSYKSTIDKSILNFGPKMNQVVNPPRGPKKSASSCSSDDKDEQISPSRSMYTPTQLKAMSIDIDKRKAVTDQEEDEDEEDRVITYTKIPEPTQPIDPEEHRMYQTSELLDAIRANKDNMAALNRIRGDHTKLASKTLKDSPVQSIASSSNFNSAIKKSFKNSPKVRETTSVKKERSLEKKFFSDLHVSIDSSPTNNSPLQRSSAKRNWPIEGSKQGSMRAPKPFSPLSSKGNTALDISRNRSVERYPIEDDLEESFDKLHTAKKRNLLSTSPNFNERMDKDIGLRKTKDKEFKQYVHDHREKMQPEDVDNLYIRLIEDTEERKQRKASQQHKETPSQNKTDIRNWIGRMDQDAKRRHYEKLERQRIKELEEKRQEEEAHKKKLPKDVESSLVNRMMNDALRRKMTLEKSRKIKMEQEVQEAKTLANKRFSSSVERKVSPKTQIRTSKETIHSNIQKSDGFKDTPKNRHNTSKKTAPVFPFSPENYKPDQESQSPEKSNHKAGTSKALKNILSTNAEEFSRFKPPKTSAPISNKNNSSTNNPYLKNFKTSAGDFDSFSTIANKSEQFSLMKTKGPLDTSSNQSFNEFKHQSQVPPKKANKNSNTSHNEIPKSSKPSLSTNKSVKTIKPQLENRRVSTGNSRRASNNASLNQSHDLNSRSSTKDRSIGYMTDKKAINYVNDLINTFRTKMLTDNVSSSTK